MKPANPVLFYTTESRFGCSQPVRSGDLLMIKNVSIDSKYSGAYFLVIEAHDRIGGLIIRGLVAEEIISINAELLEWPSENR